MNYKCPCGETHKIDLTKPIWKAFLRVTDGLPMEVPVTIGNMTWSVPRIYIAIHGLKAKELPGLGFKKL